MSAIGIVHADLRHAFRGRLPVEEEIQGAKRLAGKVELAHRGQRLQIRHV
jgi:hypothetical protein